MIQYIQVILLIVFFLPYQVFSQGPSDYQFPSSYQPLGSGARAVGMGGAFIAIADDATAASWNPGGLVQLEKSEMSIVGTILKRSEDVLSETSGQSLSNESLNYEDLNYFSLSHCFTFFQRNMVVSLNIQNLYDFNRTWAMSVPFPTETPGLSVEQTVDFNSDGNLSAIGLAYSVEILPTFSFGFTVNHWDNDLSRNTWETRLNYSLTASTDAMTDKTIFRSKYEYELDSGFNTNLGFLWQITPHLTVGGVYKARFTSDLTIKSTTIDINEKIVNWKKDEAPIVDNTMDINCPSYEYEMAMPASYGLGLAWKISNIWTVSMDVYKTDWDEFIIKTDNGKFSPLFALPSTEDFPVPQTIPTIKPTHQVRLGTEYLALNKDRNMVVPFRLGFFYDPVPGKGSPDKAFGFSIGSGLTKPPYIFDIALQYRHANNLGEDYQFGTIQSFDMNETTLYTSFIYHF